ncbi:MAG: flagellar basal body rod protein FlgB [Oligoflexales bacterium]|nr:flagellar basal body rod protein FlgB [Oligoflexales bacterium]
MSSSLLDIFNFSDRLQMASLEQRLTRSQVLHSNIANAETPGYRALSYDFEKELQSVAELAEQGSGLKVTKAMHFKQTGVSAEGKIDPRVSVRPSESVGNDGNTVDVDKEMSLLAQNQLLYRSVVESLNRKIGILKYAINGGR